jgi:hypothetical protein
MDNQSGAWILPQPDPPVGDRERTTLRRELARDILLTLLARPDINAGISVLDPAPLARGCVHLAEAMLAQLER